MDHAAYVTDLVTKLISSYGIFGVMFVLFLIGKAKKIAKRILFLLLLVGIAALFYGGYLTFSFVIQRTSAFFIQKKKKAEALFSFLHLNSFQRVLQSKPVDDHIPGILAELLYQRRYVRSYGIPIP